MRARRRSSSESLAARSASFAAASRASAACVVDSFVGYDLIIELDSATNSMSFSK